MIQDEFNKIEVTNDKQLLRVEYGKTQKFEFSSQKDNATPEGELNEKYVGKTIKKTADVNVDYVNKVPTHGTTTVVSSATTATTAASTAAATVVAASTVAVVAIATVTGISVALHDYQCELKSLFVTSNSITYQMSIVDNKQEDTINIQQYEDEQTPRQQGRLKAFSGDDANQEEETTTDNGLSDESRPFVLRVSNETYSSEHYLDYGLSSEGCFTGLTLGDNYNITLSENRYGGEVLYDESFVTHKNTIFRDFYMSGEADFRAGTFQVGMDFLDELDSLSDFTIVFTDTEYDDLQFTFVLDKVSGWQTVSLEGGDLLNSDFSLERSYNYVFSYKNNGDVNEFKKGSISFYNASTSNSEVYGVNWDKTANFKAETISFSLDFVDDANIFTSFEFWLGSGGGATASMEPIIFELEKTTEEQTVSFAEYPDFDFSETYNYMFIYYEQGNEMEQIIDSGMVTLTDTSGATSVVNGVVWDKTANLINKSFDLKLDYQDFDKSFSDFQLTLSDHEMPEELTSTFSLEKTRKVQTVQITDDDNIYLRRTQDYEFTYEDNGVTKVLDSGTVTFSDNSEGKKQFNDIFINPVPNFDDYTFDVTLDFDDDFGEISSFTLTLLTPDGNDSFETNLDAKTTTQTIKAEDTYQRVDFRKTYNYSLVWWDDSDFEGSNVVDTGSITFDTTSAVSQFNEFLFDETGDFAHETYVLQLDYIDQLKIFSDFIFEIEAVGKAYSATVHLSPTTEPQVQQLNVEGASSDYTADMSEDTFIYSFKYYDESLEDYVEVVTQQEFTFTPSELHSFNGIESNYDFTPEEGGQSYTLPIKFDYDDSYSIYTGFEVTISKGQDINMTLRFEGETYNKDWQYAILVPDGMDINDIINASGVSISVSAWTNMEDYQNVQPIIEVYSEDDVTFTLGQKKEVMGGFIRDNMINYYSSIYMTLVISGYVDDFECQLLLESYWGNTYVYNLELGTMGYVSPEITSYVSGPAFTEETFPEEFTDKPMKVSIKYRYRTLTVSPLPANSDDPTGSGYEETWSDYVTLVLYDSYQFTLSV